MASIPKWTKTLKTKIVLIKAKIKSVFVSGCIIETIEAINEAVC